MMNLGNFYGPLPDIGLFAKMRSGKDEVFKILDEMGFDVERVAFGDVLKESFFERFPTIPKNPKPTGELIAYGQALREIDPDVWVRPTMSRVRLRRDILTQAGLEVPSFVFTDIRQPNEYNAVKRSGAIMVRVEAPLEQRLMRMVMLGEKPSEEVLEAPTEKHLETFEADYVIYNSGSLDDLRNQVTQLVYDIQARGGNSEEEAEEA